MASVLRCIALPARSLSRRVVISLKADVNVSNGSRWALLPPTRSISIPIYVPATGRNLHSADTALRFVLSPTPALRVGSSVSCLRSHRKCSTSTRQLTLLRCYSKSRTKTDPADNSEKRDPRVYFAAVVLVIGAGYYAFHLERVPQTGRWRFMGVPKNWEAALAKEEHAAFLEEYRGQILPPSHPITQQIRGIVSAILEANGLGVLASTYVADLNQKETGVQSIDPDLWNPDSKREQLDFIAEDAGFSADPSGDTLREWNLIVVHDDSVVNAMAGNGNVIVFTGILPIAYDVDGLAAVLSHEIAHVVARHVAEKLSELLVMNGILYLLPFFGLDVGIGPMLMKYLYHLPNSRIMELEADKIGLQLASRACFDPRGAVSMQMRMEELERRGSRLNLSFLQTHPTGKTRVKLLSEALPEAYSLRAASSACAHLEDDFDAFRAAADKVRNKQDRGVNE